MLHYLHTTANSFTKGLLAKLFEHGAYALIPPEHASNKCQAALKGPQCPFYKGLLTLGTGSLWSW